MLDLLAISDIYPDDIRKNSFRKTVIIYTAAIIEALLLYCLKEVLIKDSVETDDWKYTNTKIIHKPTEDPGSEIVWCVRRKEKKSLAKLSFHIMNRICLHEDIIENTLFQNIDKVREMRNRLHIGGRKSVESNYTKKDLDFVFSVARQVKEIARSK
ncbi:hypothetical protein ACFL4D_00025 [Candidatus Margulisiibacteriota bacterium]